MSKIRCMVLAFMVIVSTVSAVSAVEYIDAPPLWQVVNEPVGDVRETDPLMVHIITWGFEVVTNAANGNALTTAPGSIFAERGLNLTLVREDNFKTQVERYLRGDSPFLRCTKGMCMQALPLLMKDPRTVPVEIVHLSWSRGDALVAKPYIKRPQDLCGKTVAMQAYGPHLDYHVRIATDACGSASKIKIKYVSDLTGTDNSSPKAMDDDEIAAVYAISTDAYALTSGGKTGDGSEESYPGAHILMSTKTCTNCIADVYWMRQDVFDAHRDMVQKFVNGLFVAKEYVQHLVQNRTGQATEYNDVMSKSAKILLDSEQAIADMEGLYADSEHSGYRENISFYGDPKNPRGFAKVNVEIQDAFVSLGLLQEKVEVQHARWNYTVLQADLAPGAIAGVTIPKFDTVQVAKVVTDMQQRGTLQEGELFSFEVHFKPNQNAFPADLYTEQFGKVIELASVYAGAVITVEGHSDPQEYLQRKQKGVSELVLQRLKQAAKNLSMTRANSVRDSVITYAKTQGISLDPTQFATVGHGVMQPKNGTCGHDPCSPQTEEEWRSNMRVEFRFISVEAESSVFKPLN